MKFSITISLILMVFISSCSPTPIVLEFNGENAFGYAEKQVELGPRTPGSEAHQQTIQFITSELNSFGWETEIQSEDLNGYKIQNIVAKLPSDTIQPWIIIGAHYDSRFYADQDSQVENHDQPVEGANDGASGVAVLLELARTLPKDIDKNIWFVFFDAEDQGNIEGWDWILGSRSFVKVLEGKPDSVVIIDMIGDKDLNVYYERNSDQVLQEEIWKIAADLGFEKSFIPENKFSILDDHIPFIENGITAIDIIDFDYPYWHTTQDTLENISPDSLEMIGRTLYHWLLVP